MQRCEANAIHIDGYLIFHSTDLVAGTAAQPNRKLPIWPIKSMPTDHHKFPQMRDAIMCVCLCSVCISREHTVICGAIGIHTA